MKPKVKILCFGVAMIVLIACNQNQNNQNTPLSYVEVVGTAEREIDPDIFYLSFNLESNNTNKTAINTLEKRLLTALQSLNIDTKNDLSVTSMSGDNWYWWRKKRTSYKGYQLKANSIDLVNKTCDKLDSLKIDYYLSKVDYSEIEELKKEAQQEAVKKARQKAENLLGGENKKVGELIYLQEQEIFRNQPHFRLMYDEYQYEADVSYETSSPSFKKMKIVYNVIARFSIK